MIVKPRRCWPPPSKAINKSATAQTAATTDLVSPSFPLSSLRLLYKTLAAATLALMCLSLYTYCNRTEEQFIVRWENTGPAHLALQGLEQREPQHRQKSLAQYRYIATHAQGSVVQRAQERLDFLLAQEQGNTR